MAFIELIQNNPRISILIISLLVTSFTTGITYLMTDQKRLKEIKDRQKGLKAEIKNHKDDPDKMMHLNKQMMEDMPEQLRISMKPLLVTFIPIILLIGWIRSVYSITAISSTWLWWYIGASIVFSIGLRKIFGLQ